MKLLLLGWGRVGCFRVDLDDFSLLPDIFVQGLVKRMGGECGGVSQNDEFPQGDKEAVPFDNLPDILYLHPVRGYQPEIDSFIQHSFDSDFLNIFL